MSRAITRQREPSNTALRSPDPAPRQFPSEVLGRKYLAARRGRPVSSPPQGRVFMQRGDRSSFRRVLEGLRVASRTRIIFVDFHAEHVEKIAMGWHSTAKDPRFSERTRPCKRQMSRLTGGTAYLRRRDDGTELRRHRRGKNSGPRQVSSGMPVAWGRSAYASTASD